MVLACILLSVVSCHQHHACTTANTTLLSKQQALPKALLEVTGSKMVLLAVSDEPVSIDECVGKLGRRASSRHWAR